VWKVIDTHFEGMSDVLTNAATTNGGGLSVCLGFEGLAGKMMGGGEKGAGAQIPFLRDHFYTSTLEETSRLMMGRLQAAD
jgi:hypothetical protein